jgi:hypothetical protein
MLQHILVISHVLKLLLCIKMYVLDILSEALIILAHDFILLLLLILQALIKFLSIIITLVFIHNSFKFKGSLSLVDTLAFL